jgi:hypothetical protein
MAINIPRIPQAEANVSDLSTAEIQRITDELVALRKKLLDNGATALNPTNEWSALRKEIAALNKQLSADAKSKLAAGEGQEPEDAPAGP